MPPEDTATQQRKTYSDTDIIQASSFLTDLVGEGSWRDAASTFPELVEGDQLKSPSFRDFRREFRKTVHDPEEALLELRRLRIRTLLAIGRADLENRIKPHQIRARLRGLLETLVQGAWWLAENSLREKYIHPLLLERRNINPPMAICSLSRLGAGDPIYTTGPAPIFIHSRAAEFAPALTEKDFTLARQSGKEWAPAREYFHRLASRTMSYLSVRDPAGKGFEYMLEDRSTDASALLPGALVVLFGAFERHFLDRRPIRERLALLRLRFLVGQDRLGQAVEAAARQALLRTAVELGGRLRAGINAWYRDRAKAEGLPLTRGSLLDIERGIRIVQFRWAGDNPDFLVPSPLKALDLLAKEKLISADERTVLHQSYSWLWYVANRASLLGKEPGLEPKKSKNDSKILNENEYDLALGLPGGARRTLRAMKAAQSILVDVTKESKKKPDR